MSVPKQWTNQKIPEAGQVLQLLFTVASWHGNCFIWQGQIHFVSCGPLFVITTYLAMFLSCRFICMHLYANAQCHLFAHHFGALASCLSSLQKWKTGRIQARKQRSAQKTLRWHNSASAPLTLRCPPPTFLTPTPKKMCHLEMDYGWEKERKKRKQLVIDFKESV